MTNNILFYNDSPILGGHEVMTARIANTLAESTNNNLSYIFYHSDHDTLLSKSIRRIRLPFHSKSVTPLLGELASSHCRALCKLMSAESPIYCVVSQGYIESGIHGLIAAKKLGIPLLSYIPFGYSNKELHSRFARIRDLFAGYIFNIPDAFITISSAQRVLLDRFTNNHTPIYVIPNPAEFNTSDHIPRIDWPPSATLHIGVIGRILFQQKNQNICIDVARLLNKRGFRFHFHIVGDGPDLKRLRQLVNKHSLDSDITLHGWMDNSDLPSFLSNHLDMLLIPSHYEGVPLIMLEALYYGIPFLVSDRHFVHEYNLPCNMLTDPRSAKDIASKLIDFVPSLNIDDFRSIRTKSLELHSHDHYTTAVKNTFAGFSEFIRSN